MYDDTKIKQLIDIFIILTRHHIGLYRYLLIKVTNFVKKNAFHHKITVFHWIIIIIIVVLQTVLSRFKLLEL